MVSIRMVLSQRALSQIADIPGPCYAYPWAAAGRAEGHAMVVRFFESVLLAAFLTTLGYGLGRLLGVLVQGIIESQGNIKVLQATITRRAGIERGFQTRIGALRREMVNFDRAIKEATHRQMALAQATAESLATADRIVRLVGDEAVGRQRYLALVFNKYVAGGGGAASMIDDSWNVAQEVEVWAIGPAEARIDVEKRYPAVFGFSVHSLVSAPREPVRTAADIV
jgi:hypothetical protein